ncbi:hypothetical protein [Hungatella sp. SB206]|uniref:hypothetical protein n=1 Tax=Hungatella sp. SB206 TaxID=2937758 RepID=UPI003DA85652
MDRNTSGSSSFGSRKIIILVMGLCLLCAVAGLLFHTKAKASWRPSDQKREEIAEIFEVYQPYGLSYDKKDNRLYYNGALVRYFEDVVDDDHYKEWPNQDGTVDIYALHDERGGVTGLELFDDQAFADRTPSLRSALCELQITENINGYTDDGEAPFNGGGNDEKLNEYIKDTIEEAYTVYQQYGLTYDRESDRLYYESELVGYFEDKELGHYFGPFDDSSIKIYAVRDKKGELSGLNIKRDEN